jgi:hypothetical protein
MYLLTPHLIGPELSELFALQLDYHNDVLNNYLLTPHLIGPKLLELFAHQ